MSSKATVTKRKEAQKLSQWALKKIETLTACDKNNKKELTTNISALENAFGSFDLKGN